MSYMLPASEPQRPPSIVARVAGWNNGHGASWAERNPRTVEELDASYLERFGVTRTEVNRRLLARVPMTASVLEVGCSGGVQLDALAAAGHRGGMAGVDLSAAALAGCRWPHTVTDGTTLPYDAESFGLVMTSGTLMHVPPGRRRGFLAELKRVAGRWIYGVEMWSPEPMTWDFGDLIPPAWTVDWYTALADPAWPTVERMSLQPTGEFYPLACWLMERVG